MHPKGMQYVFVYVLTSTVACQARQQRMHALDLYCELICQQPVTRMCRSACAHDADAPDHNSCLSRTAAMFAAAAAASVMCEIASCSRQWRKYKRNAPPPPPCRRAWTCACRSVMTAARAMWQLVLSASVSVCTVRSVLMYCRT